MARKKGSYAAITGPNVRAAAERLFAAEGFAQVSMRRLAAEVGVQAGALYLYTEDKESLLHDLIADYLSALMAATTAEPWPEDASERLDLFVQRQLGAGLDRPQAVVLAATEARNLTGEARARIETLQHQRAQVLVSILRDGHAQRQFQVPEPQLYAAAILAMLDRLPGWFDPAGRIPRERLLRLAVRLVRRVVGPRG